MQTLLHRVAFELVLTLAALSVARAASYEAPLPAQLSSAPDLCAYAPCRDVIDADGFSLRRGRPGYVEAYRSGTETTGRRRRLVGYVFLSTDIVDIPGYSGKPLVTLIGMDTAGLITGVEILRHSESILLVGIPESELTRFVRQYVGRSVRDGIEIGRARAEAGHIGVDAISGATVTSIAANETISRAALEIARQVGILPARPRPPAKFTAVTQLHDWRALVREGSVRRLTVSGPDVGVDTGREPYIDIYFGYLDVPSIGVSILGEDNYRRLMADLGPEEHAIFVIANGVASFKGSGFVRGGIYERIRVAQGLDSFTFRDTDYRNLYGIRAAGAPAHKESGIFIIRSRHFGAARPWRLVFLANRTDKETGARTFVRFDRDYRVPAKYLEGGRPADEPPTEGSGRD